MNPDDNKPDTDSNVQLNENNQTAGTNVEQPGTTFEPAAPQPLVTPPVQPMVTPEQTPAPSNLSQTSAQPMFSPDPIAAPVVPAKKSRKKLYIFTAVGVLLITVLAFVFLWFLPNRPDAVFSTGLDRSGQAIESLVQKATTTENLEKVEKSELTGSFEVESSGQKYTGDLNLRYDTEVVNGSVSFKAPDSIDVNAEFMAKILEGSKYPDMFFKVQGIEEVAGAMLPQIAKYDDKWISVNSEYLEEINSGLTAVADSLASTKDEPSAEETAALVKKISDTTNEYVFTSDTSKNVIEKRSFVGKETTKEGIKAYRYKVAINKDHAVEYCKALVDTVYDDAAFKKIAGDAISEDSKKSSSDSCNGIKDSQELDKTFDMWVDAKYKIIHKVRFMEDDGIAYVDLGQIYKGGDALQLFVVYVNEDDKAEGKFTVDVDTRQMTTEGNLLIDYQGDYSFKITGKIGIKPYSGDIIFEDPGNATPLQTVLGEMGINATPTGIDGIYGVEPEESL